MMRGLVALHIDFQQREADVHPRLGWLVLLLGALLLAGVYAEYADVDAAVTAARSRAGQRQQATSSGTSAASAASAESVQAMKAVNRVRDQLAAPWGALFVDVEGAAHEDIAMLTLQADPMAHTLRIGGEARNFTALMAYVRRLEASAAMADVRLAGHEVRQQDPRHPVAFTLSATWVAR
jgi:Tfp pilus assembly protein PilN